MVTGRVAPHAVTLDDLEELNELDLLCVIVIDSLNNLLNLLPILDETEGDQRIFQLVDTDTSRAVVIERVEVLAEQLALVVIEVDVMFLATGLQPVPELAFRLEYQVFLLDRIYLFFIFLLLGVAIFELEVIFLIRTGGIVERLLIKDVVEFLG